MVDWDREGVIDGGARRRERRHFRSGGGGSTNVRESGCGILPTQPHMGPGDFKVTCSIEL